MNHLFPFRLVPQGSRLILFGAGDTGKDFYLQIRELGDYYTLAAWVASSFEGCALRPPFDYVRNIPSYEFDYVVIACETPKAAKEIKASLRELGVPEEKVVWSGAHCAAGAHIFPDNREMLLEHLDFFMDITDERFAANNAYCQSDFYHSFARLGIKGCRNTEQRIGLYRLRDFLTAGSRLLDIGCNCGFLDLQVAPWVKHIRGVDVVPEFIRVAEKTRTFLGIENADFRCENYFAGAHDETYDAVFAFAVYGPVLASGVTETAFADRVASLLNENGYLFFESHGQKCGKAGQFEKLCAMFEQKGLRPIFRQTYFVGKKDESNLYRIIQVFRR